jgi:hypothetical protein
MDALSLLGSANKNAAPQGALDALSAFGQAGPKMPDFSGAQFGGQNNLAAAGATNPFAMSGAAGAAASKLPMMSGPGGGQSGGGMAGLSSSINKLIASNNKLVGALNKLAAAMGKSGGGFGMGSMGGGAGGGDPMGIFEQLNLQKDPKIRGGGGGRGGGGDDGDFPDDPNSGSKMSQPIVGGLMLGLGLGAKHIPDFKIPNPLHRFGGPKNLFEFKIPKAVRELGGISSTIGKHLLGIGQIGAGTTVSGIFSNLPFGLGAEKAQDAAVLEHRASQMAGLERMAFRTSASIGGGFGGVANMVATANGGGMAAKYGYSPEMAMENILDVYTTGGFRTNRIGGTGRDALEKSFTVGDIFKFKNVGFGSTVLGGIQEMQMRGSGARGLIGGAISNIANFGAGNQLGARGMNVLTESMKALGQQANMFGMTGGRRRLFEEAMGFENQDGNPTSFKGFQNAINRSFMTHQQMFEGTSGQMGRMFGGMADNLGFAMDVRAARQNLGAGASGVQIMREANRLSRARTPQQKVQQMREAGMSEDVIQARLLGEGLDEAQIQFALDDTQAAGSARITSDIIAGRAAVRKGGPGSKMKITSKQAAGQFERVKQTYDNIDKVTTLVDSNNALQKQLFDNAELQKAHTNAVLSLNTVFEQTSGDLVKTMNELIKAINKKLPKGKQIPSI